MIELRNIHKSYYAKGIHKQIFQGLDFDFNPNQNYAIVGKNGVGKSTLLRLIAGAENPDYGEIIRKCKISWPLGFSGGFNGSMTGLENLKFVARIYGEDPNRIIDSVFEFSELGNSMKLPIKTYSSGMRTRLAFGLSLAINFDCYIIDEVISVGDTEFRKKSKKAFEEKLDKSFVILASHSPTIIKEYCNCGLILDSRGVHYHDTVDSLLESYQSNKNS
jgi:capsular polysaccharide transport system ATP-binding protein